MKKLTTRLEAAGKLFGLLGLLLVIPAGGTRDEALLAVSFLFLVCPPRTDPPEMGVPR
jgi:hypothetical protein